MRDLNAYPITRDEKLSALDHATRLLEQELAGSIGGVELAALAEVRRQIEATPD